MSRASPVAMMEGNLEEFHLADILQVASVGHQLTRVELSFHDGVPAGAVLLLDGQVIGAVAGTRHGREAFCGLFRDRPSLFRVFRLDSPVPVPASLGALRDLLMDTADPAESDEEITEQNLASRAGPRLPALPPVPQDLFAEYSTATDEPTEWMRLKDETTSNSGIRVAVRGDPTIIGIASPKGGSGKTTVSVHLATSLAATGRSVVLVDGDVNGDASPLTGASPSPAVGIYDVLVGRASLEDAVLPTAIPNLEVVPAFGSTVPGPEVAVRDHGDAWRHLLSELTRRADVVLVDTPAGMYGITHQILGACTHVVGVLQAEVVAHRSFAMFTAGIESLLESRRPQVLGVCLNMLQIGHAASLGVLDAAGQELPRPWLFETSIPRSIAFLEAAARRMPVHSSEDGNARSVAWLFDTLANEVVGRLEPASDSVRRASLLLYG